LERAPLDELSIEAVGAAVRLLPPAEAGVCWARLEQRIILEDKWAWASTMTPYAAGVEANRVAVEGPTIMAAIRATQAAATPGRPRPDSSH
jgi:hypothetical protein